MLPPDASPSEIRSPTPAALDTLADEAGSIIPLGWRGLLLIFGFWTFFGVVMAASLLLSPVRTGGDAAPLALVVFTFLGAYTWALLTLPLFALTRRFDLGQGEGLLRIVRILGLLGFSLVMALVVSFGLSVLSSVVLGDLLGGSLAGTEGIMSMARYRFLNDLLACHLVLTAGVARDLFLRYRARQAEAARLRTQLVEARLEVLRTQLDPHFLFNTLNGVAALVSSDPKGVRKMIALLSEMLRYSLQGASEPEVTVRRELETVGRYLEIMEIRFRDRLETEVRCAEGLEEALVPNLILQPLVENAFKHAVARSSEASRVEVEVEREGDELLLRVRDSGAEAAAEAAAGSGRPGGIGLGHTEERLEQMYGGQGGLAIREADGGGVVAEVRLPLRFAGEEGRG